jgi:hypothetical protein
MGRNQSSVVPVMKPMVHSGIGDTVIGRADDECDFFQAIPLQGNQNAPVTFVHSPRALMSGASHLTSFASGGRCYRGPMWGYFLSSLRLML